MPAKKNVRPEFTSQAITLKIAKIFIVPRSARTMLSDFWADLEGIEVCDMREKLLTKRLSIS